MKWYQTQIVGVIVGGIIAFGFNWIYRWNEKRIEKRNLKAGIKAEVKVFTEFLKYGLQTIYKYKETLEKNGSIPSSKITGNFDTVFIDGNIDKLGVLEESLS